MKNAGALISLLRDAGCDTGVILHCEKVAEVAREITDRILVCGRAVPDRELIAAGALLHDIGRCKTHSIQHGAAGAQYCRNLGLDEAVCRIIERHIGGGLTASECKRNGLSPVDRIPVTLEEQIVAHADNLVKGTTIITIEERIIRCKKQGVPPEAIARIKALGRRIEELCREEQPLKE
ncbi:MAG: HDIG domain-containing protein [Methanospirillaceae archaeon]|nr:HDIG domain-containing protein [Methanospirillaceae archaeon]